MDQELFIPDQKEIFQYHATFKNYVIFDIPYKLEDTSIVKEWYIKWGTLYITLV